MTSLSKLKRVRIMTSACANCLPEAVKTGFRRPILLDEKKFPPKSNIRNAHGGEEIRAYARSRSSKKISASSMAATQYIEL